MGYLIKPTAIIVLIAITIIEIFNFILKIKEKENRKERVINNVKNILFVIVGILLVLILKIGLSKVTNYEVDEKYSVSIFHYLMMGINTDTTGAYNGDDVVNSITQNSYEERVMYNKKIFLERLKYMSLEDICEFYTKKC